MAINANLDRKFPSIAEMEQVARRRMPTFGWDYLQGGIGREAALTRNRAALDRIRFSPRHLTSDTDVPDLSTRLFGQTYAAPFGVAPVGLTGLMWPDALSLIAQASVSHNLPYGVSSSATEPIEGLEGGEHLWFQLYGCKDVAVEQDLMERAWDAGARTLIVTVDILGATRRARDIRNGLTVPPAIGIKSVCQALMRPSWSVQTLRRGVPRFRMLERYMPDARKLGDVAAALDKIRDFRMTPARLEKLRQQWQGHFIVKGILDPQDAKICMDLGADAIVVSNHGGRQLDAAPSVPDALRRIRSVIGSDIPMIADSGVRSGLDIARMLACGADFVLLGRALYYAVAAAEASGVDHALKVLKLELMETLRQVGCTDCSQLRDRLIPTGEYHET